MKRAQAGPESLLPALAAWLLLSSQCFGGEQELFPGGGIDAAHVRQGAIGSCCFHASIAAIARSDPGIIRRMIKENPDQSCTVTFSDGKQETAYPEDVAYARQSGYENSQGLWVGVLFRHFSP